MKPAHRTRRRRSNLSALLLTPLALAAWGASGASAQTGHAVAVGGVEQRGTTVVTPDAAAPGEMVWVHTAYLPPATSVQLMLGALRDGFEIVVQSVTDANGLINGRDSLQVTVPEWVTRDRPYLMIVTDAEYHPLGTANMFHPTDASGMLERVGDLRFEPAGCPVLTGGAQEIYFLVGDTSGLQGGDRVKVIGRIIEENPCGTGTTIEIQQIEKAEPGS